MSVYHFLSRLRPCCTTLYTLITFSQFDFFAWEFTSIHSRMYHMQALNTLCYMRTVCVAQTARAHQSVVSMTDPTFTPGNYLFALWHVNPGFLYFFSQANVVMCIFMSHVAELTTLYFILIIRSLDQQHTPSPWNSETVHLHNTFIIQTRPYNMVSYDFSHNMSLHLCLILEKYILTEQCGLRVTM